MRVREPIQVYLSAEERAELDRAAKEQGISRSEVLRRSLGSATAREGPVELQELFTAGYLTRATAPAGPPPPRKPVAPLRDLLSELEQDRQDR